ncbi:hypothetical protein FisN_17Hh141 [Fistulifera solaris]|uniref:EF-hand domain-containing protein n=1 Tax=Fistulifera solaris TaxID=1519565 RepID=A0A1Z5JGT9_FISSO|nr:hypothetical protein FisN_17Hh141 [Fistulifera solaris]|eukprot:GAX13209.1 hypothetical protein FisN_17Hh141 [Fistulifera solaris]
MSQGYLNRNVFERLYSTQTVASSRKQEIASANVAKPKSKHTAEINPNSRLFASTEAYKHKHDDPLHAGENTVPSRKTTTHKRAGKPPAARRLPEKSPPAKTPAGKVMTKATPSSSRSTNNKTPLFSPQASVAPQTPASASTPNTVQSTPSTVHDDATALPTLEDLVDMIEIPIEEKVTALFHSIGAVELNDLVHELEHRYPDLCTSTAVHNYTQRSDRPTGSLELAEFRYFLLFLVYFHILYDDFVFIDDDDLRISKGEFEPVAERLHLFDDWEAAYAEMDEEQEGYIMFDALCAKCARNKLV